MRVALSSFGKGSERTGWKRVPSEISLREEEAA